MIKNHYKQSTNFSLIGAFCYAITFSISIYVCLKNVHQISYSKNLVHHHKMIYYNLLLFFKNSSCQSINVATISDN